MQKGKILAAHDSPKRRSTWKESSLNKLEFSGPLEDSLLVKTRRISRGDSSMFQPGSSSRKGDEEEDSMRKNSRVTEYILMEEEEGETQSARHSVEILINEDRDRKAKSLL